MILATTLLDLFRETRKHSEDLCAPLSTEDYVVQPIEDVSPPKWHLGHTTWFFEDFILKPYARNYTPFHEDFSFVFNSYYETMGDRVLRANRGNLSRPTVQQVYDYRKKVSEAIEAFYEEVEDPELLDLLEIGIHHEKQHQELLLTDIKYILGNNPLLPAYGEFPTEGKHEPHTQEWISIEEGVYEIGHEGERFSYDNERPRHKVYLQDYEISNRLVTNAEYLDFINAGGYEQFQHWHAEGWDWVKENQIKSPLYWHLIDGVWKSYTLEGLQEIKPEAPVTHISFYEAHAYAAWRECRLPTEAEWETGASYFPWGRRWEWSESAYLPYPGYEKAPGALGEYNGKFMVSQKILRGGSIATPDKHTRMTYRNFFHPALRWQFTGIRLAR